ASYSLGSRIISFFLRSNSFAKCLEVCFALFAGLETNVSIFIFFSVNLFAISGASFFPLAFKGLSRSLKAGSPQLLLAWRIKKSVLLMIICFENLLKEK